MPVKEADPRAVELDSAFAAAMSAPAKPREAATPPEVDREAPHGRDEEGNPLAPFGHNKDGSIRKSAAGRKPKDDQARTVPAQTGAGEPGQGTAPVNPQDFSAGLMDFSETAWFGGSILAKVGPKLPLVGRLVPGRKLAATMAAFDAERPALCAALNLAAQHDVKARRLAAKLAQGEVSWALSCMLMVAPFTAATAAIWQGDKALAERELPGLDELARRNDAALDRMFAKITAQMEAAQQAQAQALAGAALANGQGGGPDARAAAAGI